MIVMAESKVPSPLSTVTAAALATPSFGIAIDGGGNAYIAGRADSSPAAPLCTPFPTTPGAFQMDLDVSPDAFVSKINSTGSALIFSTLPRRQ